MHKLSKALPDKEIGFEVIGKIVSLSNVAITITNLENKIIFFNRGAEILTGYTEKEVLRKEIADFYPDKKEMKNFLDEFKKKGKLEGVETTVITKNKEQVNIKLSLSLINDDKGIPIAAMGISYDITEKKNYENEQKKLMDKIRRIDKNRLPLTSKEKLGLCGLIRFPEFNDRELSAKLGIARTTITTIKNRLISEGYYSHFNLPRFELIGANIICMARYIKRLNGGPRGEAALKKQIERVNSTPEIFVSLGSDTEEFDLMLCKDIETLNRILDKNKSFFMENNIILDNNSQMTIPLPGSDLIALLEYSGLTKVMLEVDHKSLSEEKEEKEIKRRTLSNNEKLLIAGSTKYPYLSESAIAEKLGLSRNTISTLRKKLIGEGILKIVNISNVKKIGGEIMLVSIIKLKSRPRIEDESINNNPHSFFTVLEGKTIYRMEFFKNFTQMESERKRRENYYKEKDLLDQQPEYHEVSYSSLERVKFNFADITKKLLNVEEEF